MTDAPSRALRLAPERPGGIDQQSSMAMQVRVAIAVLVAGLGSGTLLLISPQRALLAVVASGLVAAVAIYPAVAAYVVVGITPLIAGIDRGLLIPLLRPNEALAVLVGAGLLAHIVPRAVVGEIPKIRLRRSDLSILLLAFMSSVLPLLWLAVRRRNASQDDFLYSLTIWKYYGLYLLVRASLQTERQVRRCLALGMASAALVAVIAILQSLKLFGVPHMLSTYYTHFGNKRALEINRGSSTLSLPVAVADLMIFNIAVAWAWLRRGTRHPLVLYTALATFVLGALASGQISGGIALVLCAGAIAYLARNIKPIVSVAPVALVGSVLLWPVISRRVQGFSSPEGLPQSWLGRLHNLRTYFFPELFTRFHFVLGIRPAARVLLSQRLGYVWIESGYTWLLWTGGIPFLLSFLYFIWANSQMARHLARGRQDGIGIAATASFVALVVIAVLMIFDPHLSYRGSADMLFALLAMMSLYSAIPAAVTDREPQPGAGSLLQPVASLHE